MGATDIATLFLDMDLHIKRLRRAQPICSVCIPAMRADRSQISRISSIHRAHRRRQTRAGRSRPRRTVDQYRRRQSVVYDAAASIPYPRRQDRGSRNYLLRVTEKHETDAYWAERQKLLLGELSHRVKNTLAVVQVIVRQSLRSSGANSETVDTVLDRLRALSKSHDLLLRSDWTGANIEDLAKNSFLPTTIADGFK